MIGDDPDVDILIPKRLGIHAIFLNRTGKPQPNFKVKPDAIVKDLNEALGFVEHWLKPE